MQGRCTAPGLLQCHEPFEHSEASLQMSSAGKGVGFLEVTTRCYLFCCYFESALIEVPVMRCEKTLSYAQR